MVAIGTRPEIIKMYSVIRQLEKLNLSFLLIHSGQHYDYEMSLIFIEELGLPLPDYHIRLRCSNSIDQMVELIKMINEHLKREKNISVLLVQGDTNTTLAAAIAANKLGIPVGLSLIHI